VLGDIRGTRKRCLGMVPELLTDARETSYWIYGSLFTADGFLRLSSAVHDAQLHGLRVKPINALHSEWN